MADLKHLRFDTLSLFGDQIPGRPWQRHRRSLIVGDAGSGHALMMEQPDTVLDALRDFLNRLVREKR